MQNLLGQACLSAVYQILRESLDAAILRSGRKKAALGLLSQLRNQRKNEGWLPRYKTVFNDLLGCDWDKGPVPFSVLEEIVLARHATQHEGHINDLDRWQDKEYSRKYPTSLFVDKEDEILYSAPEEQPQQLQGQKRIYVTEDNLRVAIDTVRPFVDWLDTNS